MTALLTASEYQAAIDRIIETAESVIPTEIVRRKVSEWAEERRVLKQGFCPGPFSFDVTPYLREIVDSLSPSSPVREVGLMKGSRMGATVGVGENWIGFMIDEDPGPFAYVTADGEMSGAQMELRVDELINTAGIGHKIGVQEKRKNQKTTGDRATRKAYPGGYILAGGPRAAFFKRAFGFKFMYVDEPDAFPNSIDKEGDPIYLYRRRVSEFPDSYKILWTSSPQFEHNSKILRVFKEGDQRKYFVPCKHCGHMQFLRWGKKDTPGGLRFEHDEDDRLIAEFDVNGNIKSGTSSVRYVCEKCGGEWRNADKDYFLPRGEWRPTAKPRRPGMRSYHLPTLYAPVGSVSWEAGVIDFLQIKHEGFPPLKYQVWVNTYLGEPFEDRGERPKIEALLTRERKYRRGTLPEDAKPLILTIGSDVQDDRIEAEIVAWGRDAVSWSIDYLVIPGDTGDPEDACWEALRSVFNQKYAGMQPSFMAVDAGFRTDIVYDFCDTFDAGVLPVMGSGQLAQAKQQAYTRLATVSGRSTPRVDINTYILKDEIYKNLKKSLPESGIPQRGYCFFPSDYDRQHFIRLVAEQKIKEVTPKGVVTHRYDAGGRRNEQLDARLYSLAMLYAYRKSLEDGFQDDGTLEKDELLTWEQFWNFLENEAAA